jgi:hypothetical protein
MATPTFIELLDRRQLAALFFVHITGVPYLFSNIKIPTAWDLGDSTLTFNGETYTWSPSLSLEGLPLVSAKAEPKSGVAKSGAATLTFQLRGTDHSSVDTWLSLLVRNLLRSDEGASQLVADVDVDETTAINVINSNPFPDPTFNDVFCHIGIEAIEYQGTPSGQLTTLTRGRFGSWPQSHRYVADAELEVAAGGASVTTWPTSMDRRVVSLYLVLGRADNGSVIPLRSLNAATKAHQQIWRGVVIDTEEGGDTLSFGLKTASFDHLLSQKLAARLPRARVWSSGLAGGASGLGSVLRHVGPHNWYLSWSWHIFTDGATGDTQLQRNDQRLIRDDGFGSPEDVPEGLHSIPDIVTWIAYTIVNSLGGVPFSPVTYSSGALFSVNGSGTDTQVAFNIVIHVGNIEYRSLELIPRTRFSTIIVDLGFEEPIKPITGSSGAGKAVWQFQAQKAPPLFRWPAGDAPASTPGRLYITRLNGPAFDPAPGWESDTGTAMDGYVKIGKSEIISFDGVNSETINGKQYDYLEIVARKRFGSDPGKEILAKADATPDKLPQVVQGIAIKNITLPRLLAYLAISGSGVKGTLHADYDQGWIGSGLAHPPAFYDIDGFEALAGGRTKRDQVWIDEPTSLKKFLADELLIDQLMLTAEADFDTGDDYKVRLKTFDPPLESKQTLARELNEINTRTLGAGKMGVDRSEDRIINVIKVKAGYDVATKKFSTDITARHQTSIANYGERDSITLEIKSIAGGADPAQLARSLAAEIFARWAFPYLILELSAARPTSWAWQVADDVLVTNDHVPDPVLPGRGLSEWPAKIYVKKDHLFAKDKTSSRLTMISHSLQGERFSEWAPTVLITTLVLSKTWNVAAHEFSATTKDVDISHFAAGDHVRLWHLGTASWEEITIDSVNIPSNRVTFLTLPAVIVASETIMFFANYDDADVQDRQRKWSTMSDGDGKLDRPGLEPDDPPFNYV